MPDPGVTRPNLSSLTSAIASMSLRAETAELQQDVALRRRAVAHDGRAVGAKRLDELGEVRPMLEDALLEAPERAGRVEPDALLLSDEPVDQDAARRDPRAACAAVTAKLPPFTRLNRTSISSRPGFVEDSAGRSRASSTRGARGRPCRTRSSAASTACTTARSARRRRARGNRGRLAANATGSSRS